MSKITNSENTNKEVEKTFYIIFLFSKTKEEKIEFDFGKEKTENILFSVQNNNGLFMYIVILRHKHILRNLSEPVELSFKNKKESGEAYIIRFTADDKTFIFNPSLKIKKNRISNEKNINQTNLIKITEKIDYFAKCLSENENKELGTLYKDGILFFESSHDYELIVYLFIKIFED